MGTEDEINAAMLTDPHAVQLTHSQVTDARVIGNTAEHVCALKERGPGWWCPPMGVFLLFYLSISLE